MLTRVKKIGEQYCLVLTPETMETLQISEGDLVEVTRFVSDVRYCTMEEVMAAYHATEPQHREAYMALAKL